MKNRIHDLNKTSLNIIQRCVVEALRWEWGFRGWREGGKEIFGQFMCDKHTNGYRDSFELPTADTTQPTTMKVFASNVEVTDRSSTGRYQVKSVRRHGKLDVEDSRENGALGVQEGNERKL
jgi:hypothetical protein